MAGSPVAVLFTTDGVEIPLKNSTAIPTDARGFMLVGKDSTTSRFLLVDSSGQLKTTMDQLPSALVGSRLDVNNGAWLGSTAPTVGQKAMASSIPVTLASDQPALTVGQGTAAALSGYWPVTITDGTNTMPTGDAVGRALFQKVTDGTNTAAVKAASTAAATTDPSLVVALSPNSPVKSTIKPVYGTSNQAVTITLTSLASSATVGKQSTALDNTTNLWEDILFFVKYRTGTGATTTGYVNIYGYGTVDGGTIYTGNLAGTDGNYTVRTPSELVLLASLPANVASTTFYCGPFSFCRLYGLDRLPQKFGFVFINASGSTLSATASDHAITYQAINGNLV